ncbi:MAG: hypothetical protein KAG20_03540 [Cocleimonas sp.]|nr:hypothetical protein [Cocleimonas sp.]
MWHAEYRLYLYPTNATLNISTEILKNALQNIAFIDEVLPSDTGYRYKVGDDFLSLICFMGCSPAIEMEPQVDRPFCYVEISKPLDHCVLIAGHNVRKINCPQCKTGQPQLVDTLLSYPNTLFQQSCDVCHTLINPTHINWRKSAFVANTWIILGNIYESEAVPDEKLLAALEQVTHCEWKYAYVRMKP